MSGWERVGPPAGEGLEQAGLTPGSACLLPAAGIAELPAGEAEALPGFKKDMTNKRRIKASPGGCVSMTNLLNLRTQQPVGPPQR